LRLAALLRIVSSAAVRPLHLDSSPTLMPMKGVLSLPADQA
jgi:hypothetical protein